MLGPEWPIPSKESEEEMELQLGDCSDYFAAWVSLPPILMSATQITRLLELTFIQRHNSPLKGKSEYVWGSGFCGLAWCSNHLSVYPAVHVSYSFLFAHHRYERLLGKYICTSVHVYQRTFYQLKSEGS